MRVGTVTLKKTEQRDEIGRFIFISEESAWKLHVPVNEGTMTLPDLIEIDVWAPESRSMAKRIRISKGGE